jgi:hypothetical protein
MLLHKIYGRLKSFYPVHFVISLPFTMSVYQGHFQETRQFVLSLSVYLNGVHDRNKKPRRRETDRGGKSADKEL